MADAAAEPTQSTEVKEARETIATTLTDLDDALTVAHDGLDADTADMHEKVDAAHEVSASKLDAAHEVTTVALQEVDDLLGAIPVVVPPVVIPPVVVPPVDPPPVVIPPVVVPPVVVPPKGVLGVVAKAGPNPGMVTVTWDPKVPALVGRDGIGTDGYGPWKDTTLHYSPFVLLAMKSDVDYTVTVYPDGGKAESVKARGLAGVIVPPTKDPNQPVPPPPGPAGVHPTSDPNATAAAKRLLDLMYEMEGRGSNQRVLIANHTGGADNYDRAMGHLARVDALSAPNHMACIGYSASGGLGGRDQRYLDHMINFGKKGGIIVMMAHHDNPLYNIVADWGNDSRDNKLSMVDLLNNGSATNTMWKRYLKTYADNYLLPLQDAGVAVLWRFLFEMNNSAWWWCQNPDGVGNANPNGGASDWTYARFIALWRMSYDYMVNTLGVHNCLWGFQPGLGWPMDGRNGMGSTYAMYPGKDYVDYTGGSWYNISRGDWRVSQLKDMKDRWGHPSSVCEAGRGQAPDSPPADMAAIRDVLANEATTFVGPLLFWINSHDIDDQSNPAALVKWSGTATLEALGPRVLGK